MNFDFKPDVVNNDNQEYRIQGNTLSVINQKTSSEELLMKNYDGYFLVNTNVILENDKYQISYDIARSQLGGSKSTDIQIPKILDDERLIETNSKTIIEENDEWSISIPSGLHSLRFTTTSSAKKSIDVLLSPKNNYFQSIVFATAPNYQLQKGGEVVDMVLLNTSEENKETISFQNIDIAEASETLLEDVTHVIRETPYGYKHVINLSASSSSSKEVEIGVNTDGTIELVSGNHNITTKDGNIVIRSNTLNNTPSYLYCLGSV